MKSVKRFLAKGLTKEKAIEKFQKDLAIYNKKIDAGETMKNAVKKLAPPYINNPANLGTQWPSNIFNAMIHPVRPYGIKGMIWYQGERNSKTVPQAMNYRSQLARLVSYYRSSWHKLSNGNSNKNFPFQCTQLPSWQHPQTKPVEGTEAPWVFNREMMRLFTKDVPNTSIAVSIDTGDSFLLHPRNKKPIGIRHGLLALKNTYKQNILAQGPTLKNHSLNGNSIVLEFENTNGNLNTAKEEPINSFAIAGEDKKWHWAKAEISGSKITLSSPQVPQPVAARYAWAMNPSQRNLIYNSTGLPASPFRTDDWPLYKPGMKEKDIQKPKRPKDYVYKDWNRPEMTL